MRFTSLHCFALWHSVPYHIMVQSYSCREAETQFALYAKIAAKMGVPRPPTRMHNIPRLEEPGYSAGYSIRIHLPLQQLFYNRCIIPFGYHVVPFPPL